MVIFGALGDLSRRKLLPAIYQLHAASISSHEDFAVLGVGRDDTHDRRHVPRADAQGARRVGRGAGSSTTTLWQELCERLFFVSADLDRRPTTTTAIGKRLAEIESGARAGGAQPAVLSRRSAECVRADRSQSLEERTRAAHAHAEERPWTRIVVEKPFGRSLESAQQLNDLAARHCSPSTRRIASITISGKETVQNVLVLRFANSIFEPIWNRQWIHHVQITAAETVGVEERGKYYEEAGVVRDMFQNHLLQLLTLTAMEPPAQMTAERGARREGEGAASRFAG